MSLNIYYLYKMKGKARLNEGNIKKIIEHIRAGMEKLEKSENFSGWENSDLFIMLDQFEKIGENAKLLKSVLPDIKILDNDNFSKNAFAKILAALLMFGSISNTGNPVSIENLYKASQEISEILYENFSEELNQVIS